MLKKIAAGTLAVFVVASAANAQLNSGWAAPAAPGPSPFLGIFGETTAPIGWIDFCRRNAAECRSSPQAPRDAAVDRARWAELAQVNRSVNAAIAPATDREIYGVDEHWAYPTAGRGDCEDYALLKRRILIDRGWPESALLITVVRDHAGDGHAVLTVRTSEGDVVLDNVHDDVLPWHRTGYRFIKRQSQWAPNIWVALSEDAARPLAVSAPARPAPQPVRTSPAANRAAFAR
jgi:predicted transglutaminase-like cysteine proteinase